MSVIVQGGSVSFSDWVGEPSKSPTIQATRDSRSATRVGVIAYSDIDAALLECFPAPPALPGAYPGVSYLYVDSVSIEPWPDQPAWFSCTTVPTYVYAQLTINYSPLSYDASDLLSRKTTYRTEAMLIPANSMKWGDGTAIQQEDLQAAKLIPMIDHAITYHRVAPANESAIDAAVRSNMGHINNGTFEGATGGTLLFAGADKTWTIDSTGAQTFSYEMHFIERKITWNGTPDYGWNNFWRNSDKSWQTLLDDNNQLVYPASSNFSDLFS